MDIRSNFKIALSLLFLLSGHAVMAIDPVNNTSKPGEELLVAVAKFLETGLSTKFPEVTEQTVTAALKTSGLIVAEVPAVPEVKVGDVVTSAGSALVPAHADLSVLTNIGDLNVSKMITDRDLANVVLARAIVTFKEALKASPRFSWKLYSDAQNAINQLSEMKNLAKKSLKDLAGAVDNITVAENLQNSQQLLVDAINQEAFKVEKAINDQIKRLGGGFKLFARAKIYDTHAFVANRKGWFVGGAVATVVTAGVLAYVMRNRLANVSFSKLPLINVLFGRKSVLKPVVIQPRLTV